MLSVAALATGLPPRETVTLVDAACSPVDAPSPELFVLFDVVSGACAPGGPCSSWVMESLPARGLVVTRQGCTEPLPGRFVRAGACEGRPRWRWTGPLEAGERHAVGRDQQGTLASFLVSGSAVGTACPQESRRTDVMVGPTVSTESDNPRWHAFPADEYSVVGEGDSAVLRWTPAPNLQHWFHGNRGVVFDSAPMDAAAARAVLEHAVREPQGIAVRYRTAVTREHVEGHKLRGIAHCERVVELDIEQRIRSTLPDAELGPPMRTTVRFREPTLPERCYPE